MIGNFRSLVVPVTPRILAGRCWLIPVAFAFLLSPAFATVTVKPIAVGVTLTEEIDQSPPEIIHVLTVDIKNPAVHLEPIPGQDTLTGPSGDIHQGRQEVRQVAVRHGAVAAVNGDFFPFTGDPVGAAVWNGELYSEPSGCCVMGIDPGGTNVMFDTIGFLGELQNQAGQMTAVTGVDRVVSSTNTNDLVVFTPTYGPKCGIREGCIQVALTGVNLPLRPSKLMIGTVSSITYGKNVVSCVGENIPSDGVVLAALPGGQAAAFLSNNFQIGDKAEFVCAIAPQSSLDNAVRLALLPRTTNDLPDATGITVDPAAYNWATANEAIGGGPHLIVNGQIAIDGTYEGTIEEFDTSFINDPNPRTGVGVTADGKLLIVTVDGRQALSQGVSLNDFAEIFKRYGAINAMNLDGGGSTTMAVDGMLINSIANTGTERRVANVLCVFAPPLGTTSPSPTVGSAAQTLSGANRDPQFSSPLAAQPLLTITGFPQVFTVGETAKLTVRANGMSIDNNNPGLLWQGTINDGIAFVAQSGLITGLQSGSGTVTALYNGQFVQLPITVLPGEAINSTPMLNGQVTIPDPTKPLQATLLLAVYDSSGMPIPGTAIKVSINQGVSDAITATTNIDGQAQVNLVWGKSSGGSVTVSSPGIVSKTLQQP